jgi:chromate transporter
MTPTLLALFAIFAQLSLVAVGGGNTILPEMQRQIVHVHGWMTGAEFAALFALAQAAPGPNMLVSTLLGWRIAGLPGALVATLSLTGPSSVLTFVTASLWHRFRDKPWRRTVQRGLVPVTVGLVMAAAVLLARTTSDTPIRLAITAATVAALMLTRVHPLVPLAAAAMLGALGLAG